jgi:hypothetical protein
MRHFFWGFNGVSFEISNVYVQMCNFSLKELERYNYFIIYAMKKIEIKSLSNLRPFKNMKMRHFTWGVNEVSFEISTQYVRMFNFQPKEFGRYDFFLSLRYEKK